MQQIKGWGFSDMGSLTHPPISTKIKMKAVTVRVQENTWKKKAKKDKLCSDDE